VLSGDQGPIRAKLYARDDAENAPTVVLVHGVHRLGIDEPRLMRFSRALATVGLRVVTPEVRDLSDYRVTTGSVHTVGESVRVLSAELGGRRVGLLGTSFGGGVALMAASDPAYRDLVSFVVSVGGHDDMERVARFFVTHETDTADGGHETREAHDYGAMVLVHARIEDFFPEADRPLAREAVRLWLWEEHTKAKEVATRLAPSSRARVESMFAGRWEELRPELLRTLDNQREQMRSVSPHHHMSGLRAPVFLLHGLGDTVVPKTEAEWVAKDAERYARVTLLVSPSIKHVELAGPPSKAEAARLVHFMAEVLTAAERG
jgi:pimeloyl-ACP methyl ester carboxylesterase